MLQECTVLQQSRNEYCTTDFLFETFPGACTVGFRREDEFLYLLWMAVYPLQFRIRFSHQLKKIWTWIHAHNSVIRFDSISSRPLQILSFKINLNDMTIVISNNCLKTASHGNNLSLLRSQINPLFRYCTTFYWLTSADRRVWLSLANSDGCCIQLSGRPCIASKLEATGSKISCCYRHVELPTWGIRKLPVVNPFHKCFRSVMELCIRTIQPTL